MSIRTLTLLNLNILTQIFMEWLIMQGTCTTLTVDTPPPLTPTHVHTSQIVLKEFRNIFLYQYFIWIYRRINILSVVKILLILIAFPLWNIYIHSIYLQKKFITISDIINSFYYFQASCNTTCVSNRLQYCMYQFSVQSQR